MNMQEFLASATEQWQQDRQELAKGFEKLPDGMYIVRLAAAESTFSKTDRPMVKFTYVVVEGERVGQQTTDFILLDGTYGLQPLGWRLKSFGLDVATFDIMNLEEVLEELVQTLPPMRLRLTTKKDTEFQNVKVERLLPNYDASPVMPTEVEVGIGSQVTVNGKRGVITNVDEEGGRLEVKIGKSSEWYPATDIKVVI